ncbi:immunoglobulin-like domain-containing protein [Listeria ilorinensis]|uniref:immunoglobulin-like domain-containing protein n=1 Tax=Listeria ilorinensis TaxID=2867439 RepID=UPI001EF432F4|nr:immunoglobulin-like domain-containing protein [Listeria ilorinensis]
MKKKVPKILVAGLIIISGVQGVYAPSALIGGENIKIVQAAQIKGNNLVQNPNFTMDSSAMNTGNLITNWQVFGLDWKEAAIAFKQGGGGYIPVFNDGGLNDKYALIATANGIRAEAVDINSMAGLRTFVPTKPGHTYIASANIDTNADVHHMAFGSKYDSISELSGEHQIELVASSSTTELNLGAMFYKGKGQFCEYTNVQVYELINTPDITGQDLQLKKGEVFDPLANMQAKDVEDGDLTSKIQVIDNPVDMDKVGTYIVKYQVTDRDGNTTKYERQVTVYSNDVPVIIGDQETTIKIGSSFDPMSGMKATDTEDGDLTDKLQVEGQVDTQKVGDYLLTYTVEDSQHNQATFKRMVHVVSNEKPVITGDKETTIKVGATFDPMSTMHASDKEDGDLTSKLQVTGQVDPQKIGDYLLTYTVEDSQHNQTTFKRTVHVVSNEKPVITGEKESSIKVGTTFDPMSTMHASDKEDGDLTKQLTVSGQVDPMVVGDYTLTYHVTDSDDNTATFTRLVHVQSNDAPVILGEPEVRLNPGSPFDPLDKMAASDKEDGDLTAQLKVLDNPVNTKVPGTYEVKYQVTDSDDNTTTFTKTVIVTEAPVIAGVKEIRVNPNSTFDPFDKMTASDKEDGDLTAALKVLTNDVNTKVPGTYHVTYQVTDSDGNQATFEQTVIVTHAPTIEASDQTIQQGASFDPLKVVKASDKEDGDLSNQVVVKQSNVDPQVPGVYQVTYMVKDKDGNWAEKTIQVTVQALPKKETPAPQVVSSPVKPAPKPATLPKTGDSSEWPWPAAGAALLVMSLGLLALRKKE